MFDQRGFVPWKVFFRPNSLEWWTAVVVAVLTVKGLIWSLVDKRSFRKIYVMEDGPVEGLTVALLLGLCFICVARFARLRAFKSFLFSGSLLAGAGIFLFGAGEEMAWGQRLFGFATPEAVQKFNTQNEFTVHNLEFGPVRLNKLVFGSMLTMLVVAYLFVLPIAWQFWAAVRGWVDRLAVPVPRGCHALLVVLLAPLVSFMPSSNRWEILELVVVSAVFLAFLYPLNRSTFQPTAAARQP